MGFSLEKIWICQGLAGLRPNGGALPLKTTSSSTSPQPDSLHRAAAGEHASVSWEKFGHHFFYFLRSELTVGTCAMNCTYLVLFPRHIYRIGGSTWFGHQLVSPVLLRFWDLTEHVVVLTGTRRWFGAACLSSRGMACFGSEWRNGENPWANGLSDGLLKKRKVRAASTSTRDWYEKFKLKCIHPRAWTFGGKWNKRLFRYFHKGFGLSFWNFTGSEWNSRNSEISVKSRAKKKNQNMKLRTKINWILNEKWIFKQIITVLQIFWIYFIKLP